MQKRRLGSTSSFVSLIGLGTVKFGRNENVKYPHAFSLPSDQEIEYLLNQAQSYGINLLDTAPAYGNSEERLGKLLQNHRHEWIISTKAGEEFINGQSYFDFSASAITKSIERSLARLKTDYLDIVLIHSDGKDEQIIKEKDVFSTLAKLKQAGKIRAFGMSTKTLAGGLLAVDLSDVAMVTYNTTDVTQREVITHAHQQQKGILIKKALGSGHLPVSQALSFILKEPGVSSIILGTINPDHLLHNVNYIKLHLRKIT